MGGRKEGTVWDQCPPLCLHTTLPASSPPLLEPYIPPLLDPSSRKPPQPLSIGVGGNPPQLTTQPRPPGPGFSLRASRSPLVGQERSLTTGEQAPKAVSSPASPEI